MSSQTEEPAPRRSGTGPTATTEKDCATPEQKDSWPPVTSMIVCYMH